MSGQVVPAAGSSFQQQGQVDWAALTRSAVHTSVGALARWSRAEVDDYTVQVGKVLCGGLLLPGEVQDYLVKRLRDLGRIGFIDDTLWIGFGIKQVFFDLVESEQGLCLIALCSALSVRYKDLYGAEVMRQLCLHFQPPETLLPANTKWKALISFCSGVLSTSSFELKMIGIHRIFAPTQTTNIDEIEQPTITPVMLAEALQKLGSLSKGRALKLDFTGTNDLCWLAAFAEWALKLEIAIFDINAQIVYKTNGNLSEDIQVAFHVEEGHKSTQALITTSTYLIDDARDLFQSSDETQLKLPSTWQTILRDTFGDVMDHLIPKDLSENSELHGCFAFIMSHVPRHRCKVRRLSVAGDTPPLQYSQLLEDTCDLQTIQRLLPELQNLRYVDMRKEQQDNKNVSDPSIRELLRLCVDKIEQSCHCKRKSADNSKFCLARTICTISRYAQILCQVDLEPAVSPSVYGLRYFYSGKLLRDFPNEQPTLLYIHAFLTGNVSTAQGGQDSLAEAMNGTCVFFGSLSSPLVTIETLERIGIRRGHIQYGASRYQSIKNHNVTPYNDPGRKDLKTWLTNAQDNLVNETLVSECEDERSLKLSYRTYIRNLTPKTYIWTSLSTMYKTLMTPPQNRCDGSDSVTYRNLKCGGPVIERFKQIQESVLGRVGTDESAICDFAWDHWRLIEIFSLLCDDAVRLWPIFANMCSNHIYSHDGDWFLGQRPHPTLEVVRSESYEELYSSGGFEHFERHVRQWDFWRSMRCLPCAIYHLSQINSKVTALQKMEYLAVYDQRKRVVGLRVLILWERPSDRPSTGWDQRHLVRPRRT